MKIEDEIMLEEMIETVREAVSVLPGMSAEQKAVLRRDIADSVTAINRRLFGYDSILITEKDFPGTAEDADMTEEQITEWCDVASKAMQRRKQCNNRMDERFYQIMDCAELVSGGVLLRDCKSRFHQMDDRDRMIMSLFYQKFHYFWGTLDPQAGNYETMELKIGALKEHREDFLWLYGVLEDYRSKHVLIRFLEYWLTFDIDHVREMKENSFDDYFDLDLIPAGKEEVLVDLGGFDGDTILDFVKNYGIYKKIYSFELSPENVKKIKDNTEGMHDIVVINKAAGSVNGTLSVPVGDEVSNTNSIIHHEASGGPVRDVSMVTVDDEIREKVTMIKMDIEGAEKDALKGCERHIRQEHPKLLICVYHNHEDIWKIPRMIREMDESYRFYLRSNGNQWGPSEIVLYAL